MTNPLQHPGTAATLTAYHQRAMKPHHPWIDLILRSFEFDPTSLVLDIHPQDEMFEQAVLEQGGDVDGGTAAYFSSAAQIARTVERLADESPQRVLDFGCGFGRVTRLLCACYGKDRVTASDLIEDAVTFQQEVLGCLGFVSAKDPKDVAWPSKRFDLIYVGSLFTHLPTATFSAWLEALFGRLEPGGNLLFSVHDEALKPAHIPMPESGLAFVAESEAHDIEHEVYGSTWVRASFVEKLLNQLALSRDLTWRRYPRALCGYQDLIAVTESSRQPNAPMTASGLGQVDSAQLVGSKHEQGFALELDGWALATGVAGATGVAAVAGEVGAPGSSTSSPAVVCAQLVSRADRSADSEAQTVSNDVVCDVRRNDLAEVASAIAASLDAESGWKLKLELPTRLSRGADLLLILARWPAEREGEGSVQHVLFAGSVDRLLFLVADERYRRRRDRAFELAETIEQVKASRFWRLRRSWFVGKRMLGLTVEDPDGPILLPSDRRPD